MKSHRSSLSLKVRQHALAVAVLVAIIDLMALVGVKYWYVLHRASKTALMEFVFGEKPALDAVSQIALALPTALTLRRKFKATSIILYVIALPLYFVSVKLCLAAAVVATLLVATETALQEGLGRIASALAHVVVALECIVVPSYLLLAAGLDASNFAVSLESKLWYSFNSLSPWLFVLSLSYWLAWPAVFLGLRGLGRFVKRVDLSSTAQGLKSFLTAHPSSDKASRWPLILGLILSVLIPILPHLPTINPQQASISVDTRVYKGFIDDMVQNGIGRAFEVSSGSRPLYLLLLYALCSLTGTSLRAIEIYPSVLLMFTYTLSVYLLVKRWFGRGPAALAALLTPLSSSSLGFLYGGFQANLLALSLIFTSFALLSRPSLRLVTLAVALSIPVLWIHPWTWGHAMVAIALYVIIEMGHSSNGRSNLLSLYLFANLGTSLIRDITGFGVVSATESWRFSRGGIGLLNLRSFRQHLSKAFTHRLWGTVANAPIYFFALLGAMSRSFGPLQSLLIVTSLPVPLSDEGLITRFGIDVSPHALSAVAMSKLSGSKYRAVVSAVILMIFSNAMRFLLNAA